MFIIIKKINTVLFDRIFHNIFKKLEKNKDCGNFFYNICEGGGEEVIDFFSIFLQIIQRSALSKSISQFEFRNSKIHY